MTQGNIPRHLLTFMLPLLAGQIFQNLYNSVDAIVVGKTVGTTALAAVSASSDISMLLTGFFTGFSVGGGVLISRAFGSKDDERLHSAIHTLVSFALIIGVVMGTVGILISPLLLKVVECPADVYDEARAYLQIYLVGILFTSIYNVGAAIRRAVGDSKRPFYYLIASSITNIVLDSIFVIGFKWGVQGAALATIFSQALSCTLVYSSLLRTKENYRLEPKHLFRMDKGMLKEIFVLGFPSAIQSSLVSISNMFVSRYINSFGSYAMAGIGAAKKIDRFVGMAAQAMGQTMSTFVGQNTGAKKYLRAYRGIMVALLLCAVYILTAGTAVYIGADYFIRLFTDNEEAISYGVAMVHIMLPLYYCQAVNQIFANSTRGFGRSFAVMICSITGMIGCRQLFLFISMRIDYNVRNIYFGYPVGWFFAALLVALYFFIFIVPKYKSKVAEEKLLEAQEKEKS